MPKGSKLRAVRRFGQPKRLSILRKSKHMRRWCLHNPWTRPMVVFNYAAIRIQAWIRRFLIRSRIARTGKPFKAPYKRRNKLVNKQLDRYLHYLDASRDRKRKPEWLSGGFSSWCAVRIQATFRMHKTRRRRRIGRFLVNQVASIILQTFWKNYRPQPMVFVEDPAAMLSPVSQKLIRVYQRDDIAAVHIQHCWRSFCNRRIYRYFRDLIVQRLSAASIELLRNIIPNESSAFDRAAGTHVRFRLGGGIFPPKVYYKIYTHRPLCDVNAFAPRDYVEERIEAAIVTHTKPEVTLKQPQTKLQTLQRTSKIKVGTRYFDAVVTTSNPEGTKHWYKREERNHWRPIASHLFEKIATPPWFQAEPVPERPKYFHYSRSVRQELRQEETRRIKRKWLKKFFFMQHKSHSNNNNRGLSQKPVYLTETEEYRAKELAPSNLKITAAMFLPQKGSDKGVGKSMNRSRSNRLRLPGYLRKHDEDEENADRLPTEEDVFSFDAAADLLQWSRSLDYDVYSQEWATVGCSRPSDQLTHSQQQTQQVQQAIWPDQRWQQPIILGVHK